jgi:hypothetical protein
VPVDPTDSRGLNHNRTQGKRKGSMKVFSSTEEVIAAIAKERAMVMSFDHGGETCWPRTGNLSLSQNNPKRNPGFAAVVGIASGFLLIVYVAIFEAVRHGR